MNWLRRLFNRTPENRATLTLLPDGQVILGLPADAPSALVAHVAHSLREWRKDPTQSLVFPFPVEVNDRR